ncbi:MAG: PAS domain-containing sensor histidine kinase [Ignavibacteria bacterium]|nr:PAS domain-containing sensor histidine kinase [Ignavibacteria bacterium]
MSELVKNSLQIISKISQSKCGYLVRINNSDFDVIDVWGESKEKFQALNNSLLKLKKNSEIEFNSVKKLTELKNLYADNSINSFFIQEVYSFMERNESVYIFLFSETAEAFTIECKDRIIAALTILSGQVKELLNIENYDAGKSADDIESLQITSEANDFLSEADDNFKVLLEVATDLVFFLDKDGKIVLVNEAGILNLEYTPDEIKGKHFLEIVDLDFSNSTSGAFEEAMKTKNVTRFETMLVSKYDRQLAYELSIRLISKKGKITGMLGTGKSISKLKHFEEEIRKLKPKIVEANRLIKLERSRTRKHESLVEELNRLKSEFISNISHEFRTPLASIIGFSESIQLDPDLPPEMKKEFNNVILNEGKRLAKLIKSVLDISRIEGGKVSLNRSTVNVADLLLHVIEMNKEFARQKNIELSFEHPADEVTLAADKEKLSEVFEALINNAIKFTNEYGRVKIINNNLFREVEIIVSDTGIGIPEKDLPYIFQKFYRVSRPGSEIPGTGVGLVFVKQMVDLHKGLIIVQSEAGSGTSFIIKLPKNIKIEKSEVKS